MKKETKKRNKRSRYDYGTKVMTWQLSRMGLCKFPHTPESVRRSEQARGIVFKTSKAMTKDMHFLDVYTKGDCR